MESDDAFLFLFVFCSFACSSPFLFLFSRSETMCTCPHARFAAWLLRRLYIDTAVYGMILELSLTVSLSPACLPPLIL